MRPTRPFSPTISIGPKDAVLAPGPQAHIKISLTLMSFADLVFDPNTAVLVCKTPDFEKDALNIDLTPDTLVQVSVSAMKRGVHDCYFKSRKNSHRHSAPCVFRSGEFYGSFRPAAQQMPTSPAQIRPGGWSRQAQVGI